MKFYKYHALGNDYIVMNPKEINRSLTPGDIRRICHRNFGIGSDGILLGPLETTESDFYLKIYNPDGSQAEKSGNGLRIFSRFLWDMGHVKEPIFTILTDGGKVKSEIFNNGETISIEMGKVTFNSEEIPVIGEKRDVLNETMTIGNHTFLFCAASIGNPHCVIPCHQISREQAERFGPKIETDARFPNRINVQFLKVLDHSNIQIENLGKEGPGIH